MRKALFLIFFAISMSAYAQHTQAPKLDAASVDTVVKPQFVDKYDSLSANNLDVFFNEWVQWSKQWGASHTNAICDSLYMLFYAHYETRKDMNQPYFVLPATIEMTSSDVDSASSDTIIWRKYVPHVPSTRPVLYITPEVEMVLKCFIYGTSRHTYLANAKAKAKIWKECYEQKKPSSEYYQLIRQLEPEINGDLLNVMRKYVPWSFSESEDLFFTLPMIYKMERKPRGTTGYVRTWGSEWEELFTPNQGSVQDIGRWVE